MKMRSDGELLNLLKKTARGLGGRALSIKEFHRATGIQPSVIKKRFGTWNKAVARAGLRPTPPYKRVRDDPLGRLYLKCRHRAKANSKGKIKNSRAKTPVLLGRASGSAVMPFEPRSESGVVLLFGALAEKLCFRVIKVDKGFPDMIAWRRLPQTEHWQQVRVEFEVCSRNYITHGHPLLPRGLPADVIICWEHNWPDCPIEVIELCKLAGA
ncbi:MAG: hypothetical protein ABIH04_06160 [Planctomycetota bacterium]